eukprot:3860087-Prymnesium_polylepis.1
MRSCSRRTGPWRTGCRCVTGGRARPGGPRAAGWPLWCARTRNRRSVTSAVRPHARNRSRSSVALSAYRTRQALLLLVTAADSGVHGAVLGLVANTVDSGRFFPGRR